MTTEPDKGQPLPPGKHLPEEFLESRSLSEYLGVSPCYAPEEFAPPVDRGQLRRLVRGELPQIARDEVCRLISTFRSWESACSEIVREAALRSDRQPQDPSVHGGPGESGCQPSAG